MRLHRRQPTRLLCPWDSPGKNTGMGCHFLLHVILLTSGLSVLFWKQVIYGAKPISPFYICCQWTQPSMLPWGQDRVSSQSFHQKCFFSFVTVLIPCVFTFRSLSKLFWKWARMLYPVQLPLCVQELGARNQTHRKPTAWWPHLTRSKSKVPVWVPLCSLKGVLRS